MAVTCTLRKDNREELRAARRGEARGGERTGEERPVEEKRGEGEGEKLRRGEERRGPKPPNNP